jgi:putative membrane protein
MGAAEVVPGISGSTGAFLTGIYEGLIRSIRSIDRHSIKLLLKLKFSDFWRYINGNILLTLVAGILTGLLSISRVITYVLKYNPILIGSFVFSLILIAFPLAMREDIKKWEPTQIICFLIALLMAYSLTFLPPLQAPRSVWFLLFTGVIIGSITFIPGISMAFILIMLGQYEYVTSLFFEFNIPEILIFISGLLIGLIGFSRFLSYILGNYRKTTLALLAGFMVGSLNKVWPWREVLEYVTNRKGEQVPAYDRSILPWDYFAATGKDPQVFQAILMMALGVFIVVSIEKIASRLKTKI